MRYRILVGDCRKRLRDLPANSVDAVVTDPPYELKFMGKKWDASGVSFKKETWEAILQVMKPGAYLIAMGGTRTHHRLTAAIEDAGFIIRDTVVWLYGSGFPKSQNISKMLDKQAGAKRKIVGTDPARAKRLVNQKGKYTTESGWSAGSRSADITTPATSEAKEWEGWGTALKPAVELCVLAQKPLSEPTIAKNVLKHRTGGINIDATRVGTSKNTPASVSRTKGNALSGSKDGSLRQETGNEGGHNPNVGRWPANVILTHSSSCRPTKKKKKVGSGTTKRATFSQPNIRGNAYNSSKKKQKAEGTTYGAEQVQVYRCVEDCPIHMLDQQSGKLSSGDLKPYQDNANRNTYSGNMPNIRQINRLGDAGGASRFFYCAKASRAERNSGLEKVKNDHPTVKPIKLMQYLVSLVTPPGGTVLDPFVGSGTTGVACAKEGFSFIGIERDTKYAKIAKKRIIYALKTRRR